MASFPYVQSAETTNTNAITFSGSSTAGDIIVAYYGVNSGSGVVLPTSVTDNNGNTYHKVATLGYDDTEGLTIMYVAVDIVITPNNPITVTFNGASGAAGGGPSLIILEYGAPSAFQVFSVECDQGNNNCQFQYQGITLDGTGDLTLVWAGQAAFGNSHVSAIIFADQFGDILLVSGNYDNHTSHGWTVTPSGATVREHTIESGGQTGAVADWPVDLALTCGTIPVALAVSCNNPPDGTISVPYTHSFIATGGTPPYTFSITSGVLPTGLSMDSSGNVTGTPTATGTFTFTVHVVDAVAGTADVTCSIHIGSYPPLIADCNNPPTGNVGVPYTHTLNASGGTPPYTFTIILGSLPPGLSLNSSTGVISGTPTTAGNYTFTVEIEDALGTIVDITCSITIGGHLPMRLTACDQDIYFDYTDTDGNAVCLRYEIPKKRWFLHSYGDGIVTHYLAEGSVADPLTMDLLMPSRSKGLIYKSGGNDDDGKDINVTIQTPSFDGGDQRSQKLYVDVMNDMEGTGTIEMAAFYNNSQSNSSVTTLSLVGPRIQTLINIAKLSDLTLYRNISMKYSWVGGPDGPKLYAMEPSGYLQPYISTFWETQFFPFSFPGWKHMRRMFPAIICNDPILLTIKTQDGRVYGPFTIASTSGQYRIVPQMLTQNIKDLAFALQVDGQGKNFALFLSDFTIEMKEWTEDSYIKLAVFKS